MFILFLILRSGALVIYFTFDTSCLFLQASLTVSDKTQDTESNEGGLSELVEHSVKTQETEISELAQAKIMFGTVGYFHISFNTDLLTDHLIYI